MAVADVFISLGAYRLLSPSTNEQGKPRAKKINLLISMP